MDCFGDEYQLYWETNMYLQTQELESCWDIQKDALLTTSCCGYNSKDDYEDDGLVVHNNNNNNNNNNSVSVDDNENGGGYSDAATAAAALKKNIINERIRRKQLNERLMALRAVVPNITKMDKATIITDAINYIKELKEQVQRIEADIRNLQQRKLNNINGDHWSLPSPTVSDHQLLGLLMQSRKCSQPSLIDDLNIRVSYAGKRSLIVSLTCANKKGVLTKMCESFEGLKLKVITAHISAFNGMIIKTVYVEADEQEKDLLKNKIEMVISSSAYKNGIS